MVRSALLILIIVFLLPQSIKSQADTSGVIVGNIACNGGHNGSILYNITGGPGPVKYSWSTGKGGYATGSCTYLVTLNNPGSALTQFQVNVNVPLVPGMDSSFSNVLFIDSAGNRYPFWLTDFPTDSSASFWVRVPSIPPGISTFYLSYCGNDTISQGNPYSTFEFFDNFDSGSIAAYTGNCFNIDQGGESCNSSVTNSVFFSPGYSLTITGASSCFTAPFDGAGGNVTRTVALVNDSLVIDYEDMAAVTLYGFCSGGTNTTNTVFANGINLGNGQSIGEGGNCATNTGTWSPETSLPFAVTTGSASIELQTYGGDCDNSQGWFDDVRIRKYRANPPVVTLSQTPQLVLDSLAAGNYTLTLITQNGDTVKRIITVNQPNPIALTSDSANNPCAGVGNGQAWVDANGGTSPYTFLWSNGATSNTILNLANGTYYVTVTDQHQCTATISVNIELASAFQVMVSVDSATCGLANGVARVTVTGGHPPYSYVWLHGVSDSSSASGLSPMQYEVTISDTSHCSVVDTFSVGAKNAVTSKPNLGADTSICPGSEKITLNAGNFVTYHWQDSSTQQHFTVVDSGTYWVVVSDTNGCKTSDTILVADMCVTSFAVPNAFSPNGDGKNDFFVPVFINPPSTYEVHIYDRWGDLVFESNNITPGWDGKFKGKVQQVGTYIYYIQYTYPGQKAVGLHGAVELLR
jgi:gliding motility-associated-like protein